MEIRIRNTRSTSWEKMFHIKLYTMIYVIIQFSIIQVQIIRIREKIIYIYIYIQTYFTYIIVYKIRQ